MQTYTLIKNCAMKNPEKVKKHIVHWLQNYIASAKMQGFVVGVSGGIDSAVTSTLCALTNLPVICLEMPIHQEARQVNRAQVHIQWLEKNYPNVQAQKISLTGMFENFKNNLPETDLKEQQNLSLANTRARFRMATLYYFAALHRYLVAGTGNKVEDFGVGFYTKYGDGGVDLSPIADLMKTEVFALGAHLGVIDSILNAAPTDGLWDDGRTDEQQLGASYPEMEWAMEAVTSSPIESSLTDRQKEVLRIYKKHHNANRHKMDPIPVCKIPDNL